MRSFWVASSILFLLCIQAFALTIVGIGQSNLCGSEALPFSGTTKTANGVVIWNKERNLWESWNLGTNPPQFCARPLAGGNPAKPDRNNIVFSAAEQIARTTGQEVRVIMCAEGGRPISKWSANQPLWKDLVTQIKASGVSEIDGLFFHQGEANFGTPPKKYLEALNSLLKRVESLSSQKSMQVILGEIPAMERGSNPTKWTQNESLMKASEASPSVHYVSLSDLPLKSDNIHLTGYSVDQAGKRYAQAFIGRRSIMPSLRPTRTVTEIPREFFPHHNSTRFIHEGASTKLVRLSIKRWEPFYWPLHASVEFGVKNDGEIHFAFGGMAYATFQGKKVHFLKLKKGQVARLERVGYYEFKLKTNASDAVYSINDDENLVGWFNPGGDGLLRKSLNVISLKNQVGDDSLKFDSGGVRYDNKIPSPMLSFQKQGRAVCVGVDGVVYSVTKSANVSSRSGALILDWEKGGLIGDILVIGVKLKS